MADRRLRQVESERLMDPDSPAGAGPAVPRHRDLDRDRFVDSLETVEVGGTAMGDERRRL